MKYFFLHILKRHIFPFLLGICLFLTFFNDIYPLDIYPFIQNFSTIARAEASSNQAISKATPLTRDSIYQNTFFTDSTHYYCLYSGAKKETVLISIQSARIPSFSFQLYDSQGKTISPANFKFLSSGKKLRISYVFSPGKSYLFALESLSKGSISYTIKQTSMKQDNSSTPKKKRITLNKTTSKQKNNINKATSKQTNISNNKTSSKQNNDINSKTTSKQTNKNNIKTTSKQKLKKITLSHTFMILSNKKTVSISAFFTPKKYTGNCQWSISDTSILKITSQKKTSISLKAHKPGAAIVTCRILGKETVSASCIIKIK